MPRLLKRIPNAHLAIVGQGPFHFHLFARRFVWEFATASHLPAVERRRGSGPVFHLRCVRLPAGEGRNGRIEGLGLVFAEAHAHGKPVVAGKSGGAVEAVTHDETGLLVDPGNPEELADAIARILSDAEYAHRLGDNGRMRVERELNWHVFTNKMLAVLGVRE